MAYDRNGQVRCWHTPEVLLLTFLSWFSLAATPAAAAPNTPTPVHEEMFVKIGGIEQWVTINGGSRDNPVILFLHGGPGGSETPFADVHFSGWDKDFTMVQWDQRGAGRTFGKTGPAIGATMTIDRMTQDGVEVATYLRDHLHKKKIILVGASWGRSSERTWSMRGLSCFRLMSAWHRW